MESRVVIADCCLKQQIKKISELFAQKKLSYGEIRMLCVCQIFANILVMMAIIQFQLTYRLLDWVLANIVSDDYHIISSASVFMNMMFLIQLIENIKEIVRALRCNCDYRSHIESGLN
jgi:hypothetical protein